MKAEESCIEENNMTISGSSKAFVKQTETYRKTMADIVVHASIPYRPWQHIEKK
jgi:hypothetical protein